MRSALDSNYLLQSCLLGIQFNNKVFLDGEGNFLPLGHAFDSPLKIILIKLKPTGNPATGHGFQTLDNVAVFPTLLSYRNNITGGNQIGGYIHLPAVDVDMIVADKLATVRPRACHTQSI